MLSNCQFLRTSPYFNYDITSSRDVTGQIWSLLKAPFFRMSSQFNTVVEEETARLKLLHPTPEDIPGCLKLFDDFLMCNGARTSAKGWNELHWLMRFVALGSQLRSLYRYGGMASCSRKLEDFKFCMSLKALSAEDKREAWIRRRAEWWATRRLSKSSEDVWDVRKYVYAIRWPTVLYQFSFIY